MTQGTIESNSATAAKDLNLVGHVQVALVAELGQSKMTVAQLFKLEKRDVVTLDQTLDAPVTLLLNGKAVARGELLAVEEHLGVRITELL